MRCKGNVTIYFALVFMLLSSLFFSVVAAVEISGTKAYASAIAKTAGESVLGEYFYPLYDEYHIFALDSGYKSRIMSLSTTRSKLDKYGSYGVTSGNKDLFFKADDVSVYVDDFRTLYSKNGSDFYEQAVDYMKYHEIERAVLMIKNLLGTSEEAETVSQICDEKEKLLLSLSVADEKIYRLMYYIDGISADKNGYKQRKNGDLYIADRFVKQLCVWSSRSMEEQYSNVKIFNSISSRQIDPRDDVDRALDDIETLKRYVEILYGEDTESRVDKREIEGCIMTVNDRVSQWNSFMKDISYCINKAYPEVEDLISQQTTIKKALDDYALFLDIIDTDKTKDIVQGFRTEYYTLRDYYGSGNSEILSNAEKMKSSLMHDRALVNALDTLPDINKSTEKLIDKETERYLKRQEEADFAELERVEHMGEEPVTDSEIVADVETPVDDTDNSEDEYELSEEEIRLKEERKQEEERRREEKEKIIEELDNIYSRITDAQNRIAAFRYDGLWFSYGAPSNAEAVADKMLDILKKSFSCGILYLMGMDVEDMSKKSIASDALPSDYYKDAVHKSRDGYLLDVIKEMRKSLSDEGAKSLALSLLEEGSKAALFEEYIRAHYGSFLDKNGMQAAMYYEREYIVFGNKEDVSNMLCMALSIFAMRFITSMLTIMTNQQCQYEAELFALSTAGVVGLPAAVAIVKYGVLSLWAFEEATLETAAILKGKTPAVVSLEPRIKFGELLMYTPQSMRERSDNFISTPGAPGYEAYLLLMNLLTDQYVRRYRAMDLIQANLQEKYRKSFFIKNAITALDYREDVQKKLLSGATHSFSVAYHIQY